MKNFFLKFKDEKWWLMPILVIISVMFYFQGMFSIGTLLHNVTYGLAGLFITGVLYAICAALSKYIYEKTHYIHTIECDDFDMALDTNKKQWVTYMPINAKINGKTVRFIHIMADKTTRKYIRLHSGSNLCMGIYRATNNGMTIEMYGNVKSLCMTINGKVVVERNMINFKVLEEVLQSQNKTQN